MKYETWFAIKFKNGKTEYHEIKSIKLAMQLLKEIDTEKSKCDAKVVIFKYSKETKKALKENN